MTEQEALVVLNAVPGLGSSKIRSLCSFFGSAVNVLKGGSRDLNGCGIVGPTVVQNLIDFSKDKFLADEYNLGQRKGISILTMADEAFPPLLREIPGAPVVLYIWGNTRCLQTPCIGMVGSRICSHYGLATARRFAVCFAQAGLTVVSGLARGIDTASHSGCLDAGGKTIAVIGCGMEHVYPKENSRLMQQISRNGAVVSEMPMQTPPLPIHFPRRNRIISGLSLVTVVVEAGIKSGALITASYAAEQGRDLFAIPANTDYETAQGSNALIKDGAQVALNPEDVLEVFRQQLELVFPSAPTAKVMVSGEEMNFYKHLTSEPLHLDELLEKAQTPVDQAAQTLLNLELRGIVKQLPGKYYVKV